MDNRLNSTTKITILFCCVISTLIITYSQKQYLKVKRDRCQLICEAAANRFKNDINNYLNVNSILQTIIIERNGNLENFENIASNLCKDRPALEAIMLAPKGTITKIWPESYSHYNGYSLFSQSETKIGSSYALKTKNPYLIGPVTIDKNITELIIECPVFTADETGSSQFWGFTVIHLSLTKLFSTKNISFLDNAGYYFSLWKPDPLTMESVDLINNTNQAFNNPCRAVFNVTNSTWTLYTEPKDGWFNKIFLAEELFAAILISVVLTLLINFMIRTKNRDETLTQLSYRDSLTSLYNMRKFMDILKDFQKQSKAYTIIYIDLNDFKHVNDMFGHDTGNQALIIAAKKLSNSIKESDYAFRIGGDEFTLILPGNHETDLIDGLMGRIKDSISREIVLKNARLKLSASCGYARCPEDSSDYETVTKMAEDSMYEDKRKSKQNLIQE